MNIQVSQELIITLLDQIKRYINFLKIFIKKKILMNDKFAKIEKNIENKILKLFKFAKKSPNPDYKKILKLILKKNEKKNY